MSRPTTIISFSNPDGPLDVSVSPCFLPSSPAIIVRVGSVSMIYSDPADVAAVRDACAGAHHQLVGELVARGEWVECDRCGEACAKGVASFPHDGPDSFGVYDLFGTLCSECAPEDDFGRTFGAPLAESVPVPGDAVNEKEPF